MSEADFIKAIEQAQRLPETLVDEFGQVPDLLSGVPSSLIATRNLLAADDGKIPGGKTLNFEYKSARLTIGKECTGFENGMPVYEDVDESNRLKEIMDASLNGEAIIVKKQETFLKDGTVIIWVEWMTTKATASKKDKNLLSIEQLMSPESPRTAETDSGDSDITSEDDEY